MHVILVWRNRLNQHQCVGLKGELLSYCFLPAFWHISAETVWFFPCRQSPSDSMSASYARQLCMYSMHAATWVHMKKEEKVIGQIIRAAVELNKDREMREVQIPPGEPSLGRQSENDEPYAPACPLCYHGDRGEREWCVYRTSNVRETIEGGIEIERNGCLICMS